MRLAALGGFALGFMSAPVFARDDPWPGSAGVEIGNVGGPMGLGAGYEPSGAVWHPRLGVLVIVGDDGNVSLLEANGTHVVTYDPGGDLEGVTIADPASDLIYLGREHPDAVLEFDLATGALTGNAWDLTPFMTGPNNRGLEALTYVDGLFYAGHQAEGTIYVFDLGASGAVALVRRISFAAPLTDLSGLHYDARTRTLYSLFDSSNVLIESTRSGFVRRTYTVPGNDQEGIAVVPDCSSLRATVFVAEDSARVWRYSDFPIQCRIWGLRFAGHPFLPSVRFP